MSEDFTDKWLRVHLDFGCDYSIQEKFDKYLNQNISYISLLDNEDLTLQLGTWYREDLDKVRIHTYNIRLNSDKFTFEEAIHFINLKLKEYMYFVNCNKAYCVFSEVFMEYPYFDVIEEYSLLDNLIVHIDREKMTMEIDLIE